MCNALHFQSWCCWPHILLLVPSKPALPDLHKSCQNPALLVHVWVRVCLGSEFEVSLCLPFKIHSQLTSGQEVGWGWECPSETQFQEIGLCFSLSSISQTSLMELAKAVIENTVYTPDPENGIFQGRGPEIWLKRTINLFCPSDFFF